MKLTEAQTETLKKVAKGGGASMTEKRARALHRAMWRWLAKHPGEDKSNWPGWRLSDKVDAVYLACKMRECFACWIADDSCMACPIKEKAGECMTKGDLWGKYLYMLRARKSFAEWADVCNRMADAWREIPEN